MARRFRLIAWNIRAGGGRRADEIARAVQRLRVDAVVLSEFRSSPPSLSIAAQLAQMGLHQQVNTLHEVKPATNALLIAARTPLKKVPLRHRPREAGRWSMVRLQQPRLALAAMHIPNQHTGRKPAYHEAVLGLTRRWRGGPAILTGDTNSGRIGEDEQTPVFNQRTHKWFEQIHANGWRDAFRHRHGSRREFTWYSPGHNNGFRLDQAFVSPELAGRLLNVHHLWLRHSQQLHRRDSLSDHAALVLDLDLQADAPARDQIALEKLSV